jgi:adenosylmethionine-8-amino-7-oxononanoate aminotransferase
MLYIIGIVVACAVALFVLGLILESGLAILQAMEGKAMNAKLRSQIRSQSKAGGIRRPASDSESWLLP